jgi:ppGpp synthetase/RelA/SpoT-type nucleotidyltranferase
MVNPSTDGPSEREISAAVARFVRERPKYSDAAESVGRELQMLADGAQIRARLSSRAKDVRSFHKKILEKDYRDPWSDVTDKAGVRLILEEARDVDRLAELVTSTLGDRLLRVEDRRSQKNPEQLGYSGVHLQIVSNGGSDGLEVEVQLRTGAQDLWSVVSHRLLYKPAVELPAAAKHAAYRLVTLVELFDEEVARLSALSEELGQPKAVERQLLDAAEGFYLELAHSPSSRPIGERLLEAIRPAYGEEEWPAAVDLLRAFVDAEKPRLRRLYSEYGPHGPLGYLPDYLLFGQAESLLLLERLERRRHAVVAAWGASGLPPTYLSTLADAAGISLPGA